METFKTWGILAPELREHCLSYCGLSELSQYAQCSKLSNTEIQKFDTTAPESVKLAEIGNDQNLQICLQYPTNREVSLHFLQSAPNTYKLVRSEQEIQNAQIIPGNARQDALQYLENRFRYGKNGTTNSIQIACKHWPEELLRKIPALCRAPQWEVHVTQAMYDAFMECMSDNPNVQSLCLDNNEVVPFVIPATFFKTRLFQQLKIAIFHPPCSIEDEDFLASTATELALNSSTISDNAINMKIQNWYDDHDVEINFLAIRTPNGRVFNLDEILIDLPIDEAAGGECIIERQDGMVGKLYIQGGEFVFFN